MTFLLPWIRVTHRAISDSLTRRSPSRGAFSVLVLVPSQGSSQRCIDQHPLLSSLSESSISLHSSNALSGRRSGRTFLSTLPSAKTKTLIDSVTDANDISIDDNVNANFPTRRSKTSIPTSITANISSLIDTELDSTATSPPLDARAEAKLAELEIAKAKAQQAKERYFNSLEDESQHHERPPQHHAEWVDAERILSLSYSQAIKYTSRIPKNPQATVLAENLLYEWMTKLHTATPSSSTPSFSRNAAMRQSDAIESACDVMKAIDLNWRPSRHDGLNSSEMPLQNLATNVMPPPASKDYINLLRAYSKSKARRKGEKSEAILANMLLLAKQLVKGKVDNQAVGTNGRHYLIDKESVRQCIPDSKAFSLAVKCYGGSTHAEALDRIFRLNRIHDDLAQNCQDVVPGLYKDDPYVLFHSIKSLKNFQIKRQIVLAEEWLHRLHGFILNPKNIDYLSRDHDFVEVSTSGDNPRETFTTTVSSVAANPRLKIDVTSAYTNIIRQYACLRGTKGAASAARSVLDRMHEVHDVHVHGWNDFSAPTVQDKVSSEVSTSGGIASIDIRSNAYNLVLGLYRDSKQIEDASKAIELLERMVKASAKVEHHGVPLPTEQSFEFAVLALAKMSDRSEAVKTAERLVLMMENQEYMERSIIVYNALLSLCTKTMTGTAELYDKALDILRRLNEMSTADDPNTRPTSETLSLVIKACALSEREDHDVVLQKASDIFSQLEQNEVDSKSSVSLTDSCYYHMMKCVVNHTPSPGNDENIPESKVAERIQQLFSQACQRGLCSSNVLNLFRNNVTEERYRSTVGNGRLADNWLKNVTGHRALYTDGSMGGKGKNARRQGKSTSDWKKRQKANEERIFSRREAKLRKRQVKKRARMQAPS